MTFLISRARPTSWLALSSALGFLVLVFNLVAVVYKARSTVLAYDGIYDTQPSTWYFPAPGSSRPGTLGYSYGDVIYQSPGYEIQPSAAHAGYIDTQSRRMGQLENSVPIASQMQSVQQSSALKRGAALQSLADSDPIMQSVGYVIDRNGLVNGALPLSPATRPTVSVRAVRPFLAPPAAGHLHRHHARLNRLGWSYGGDGHGPAHWAKLRNWGLCGSGTHQSPINLELNVKREDQLDLLRWISPVDNYVATLSPPSVSNTFRLDGLQGKLHYRGEDFELSHLLVHTPSEHRWLGRRHAAEIQFVHTRIRSTDPALAIAAFVEPGEETPAALRPLLAAVHGYLATQVSVQQPGGAVVTLPPAMPLRGKATVQMNTAMLSTDVLGYASNYANYFSYYGSETQPPCREGVTWLVLKTPLQLRGPDLDALVQAQGATARPTQEMHGRIVEDIATGESFQTPA